ncbi:hypothetical protein CJF30_00010875 [Rutstroemia sp. NJR-2017a BBW]|nr:hypothetical protein CJF30_00010875 [Rutstroemia sp. NJR-2017a BBW]
MAVLIFMTQSSDFGTMWSLRTKHMLILLRRVKVECCESRERVISQRILKKDLRSKVSDSTLRHGSVGGGKAEKLTFYNDEQDKIEQPPMPPKPRRRPTSETEEDYRRRIAEWEASKPHAREVKVQGNAMTQKYYFVAGGIKVNTYTPVVVKILQNFRIFTI